MLPLQQQPENICIFRLSALGDATHAVPVVRAIQDYWPETKITWIIGLLEYRLLGGIEGVEFIPFDKKGGWTSIHSLRESLRKRRFDVLLQMQVSTRANLLSRLVRAPVRVGWDRARSRELHYHFLRHHVAAVPHQHQVQGFLEFARALGIPAEQPVWNLPIEEEATAWAEKQVSPGQAVVVINPCSSEPSRNWRPEYYAEVADYAVREKGVQLVLAGGPNPREVNMGREIESCMKQPCLNLVGKDTLERSKAMLKRADLLISPDSGPAHIASALNTPVLGLHAATWSRRSGPYNSLDLCVDRYQEATQKFMGKNAETLRWGARVKDLSVMDLVRPEDVIERLNSLLD